MRLVATAVTLASFCFAASAVADDARQFTVQARELTQQYARASGQCDLHWSGSEIAQKACPRAEEYAKRLSGIGWRPADAKARLFDGCARFSSAYQLAAISRDTRQPPDMAFKRLLADKTLRITEPVLKSIVNTAYFEDWALTLAPLQLAQVAGDDCRYGSNHEWKPLK